jgi:lipopolysaccharide/colanic/teichoic acid biosynthesis glycosyltransferase
LLRSEWPQIEISELRGEVAPARLNRSDLVLKRSFDIVVGSLLAIAVLPVIIMLSVGCAVALRSSPFFLQHRVGKGGRPFVFPKLRTLPTSTPPNIDKYALNSVRIPRFCSFLRRSHLDELPQLLIVPFGRMSLVGPRPEMLDVLRRYPAELVSERIRVRPGCTGLWQISGSVSMLIYEAPQYDRLYIRRGGPLLDYWILYRTARLWLSRGAHVGLDDVPDWVLSRGYVTPNGSTNASARFEPSSPGTVVSDRVLG